MTVEQSLQRADMLGTQVITRDGGKRLGIVSQIWVDIDRREVVALGLRDSLMANVLSTPQQTMLLSDVQEIGDVILVDDDTVLDQDIDVEIYSDLINCEVITETGETLGKVRGYKFNATDGKVTSLVIASLGIPQIPDQVLSTYELPLEEVVSSGPDRLIVFEGAEEKMVQITVGVLERLGIGSAPWDRGNDDYYVMPTSPANQLGTGTPTTEEAPAQAEAAAASETWDEDNWNEAEPVAQPLQEPVAQAQVEAYQESNWDEVPEADYVPQADYVEEAPYTEYSAPAPEPETQYEDYDVTGDAWASDEGESYQPQKLNIPEKKRVVEYEEEPDY
ncbi:MAG: PRC-barrel domain-containing protein [Cyanobacteria bacterium P01_A01_bin.135]